MRREKAVCDSSVLINFARIGRLDLLLKAFERPLLIPREAYAEAVEGGIAAREPDALVIKKSVDAGDISVRPAKARFDHPFLDAGEKAVISLALESRLQTACVDEAPARNAARQAGLRPVGSLGVLTRLLKGRQISKQQAFGLLEQMIRRDYRISAKILEEYRNAVNRLNP